jgi:hypothetical protein
MVARPLNEGQVRPDVGDTLTVVHDFVARSSDELSLAKGDRVELIERDDEFGDGWFLGRHLTNGNTGLFPEVYTRPIPKTAAGAPAGGPSAGSSSAAPTLTFTPSKPLTPLPEAISEPNLASSAAAAPQDEPSTQPSQAPVLPQVDIEPLPLVSNRDSAAAPTSAPQPATSTPSNASRVNTLGRLENGSQDSQVLSETLNVINEHITDLRSPSSNSALRVAADSGSEYSASIDPRASYIQGEETDEEDEAQHTRSEVETWNADQVAEYLFTSGVEKQHCEVFRDQEITGEVLLGMDQSSIFLKAFDLGSVGRRLKTWQKIKNLQDEAHGLGIATRRTTQTYGSEVGSEDGRRSRARTSTISHSISNPPLPTHNKRLSLTPSGSPTAMGSPSSPHNLATNSPTRPHHAKRPSAASIRDINHSRRHSSTDFRGTGVPPSPGPPKLNTNGTFPLTDGHRKQPSFDRNWTLGSAISQNSPRPLSSAGLPEAGAAQDPELQDSAVDLERGYFSGNEVDGRKRNVLRKRSSATHSRKSSYAEEQRVRSATAISRHSRYGSIDSTREAGGLSPAVQKYYGIQPAPHRRRTSTNASESMPGAVPPKDVLPPTVTRLDGGSSTSQSSPNPNKTSSIGVDWPSFAINNKPLAKAGSMGMRVTSDTTGQDSLKTGGSIDSPSSTYALDSPSARTGSTTPSGGRSFELDSPDAAKSPSTMATASSKSNRKKGKKETSAYTRGLLKIGPREAMKDADYSGWMRKKSSNLMTTWKPRFFVLKGRRLSYYYSDDDQEEKGLIDISFHRVLPAGNEKLTGLHATITGAVSGPALPNSQLPGGSESTDAPKDKESDAIFIFKLVPPRAGLSRAVTFTKPTVHYFAVPNLNQGRLWMAALMKATIDRDDTKPVVSTYQPKTISLAKARQMRHRPPALMNLDEANEEENQRRGAAKEQGSQGLLGEADSGVSGLDKQKIESARLNVDFGEKSSVLSPQSA